jgi:hypothetical protein
MKWKARNSSINHIAKLQEPTLFIQSKEDPFTMYMISHTDPFLVRNSKTRSASMYRRREGGTTSGFRICGWIG